MQDGARVATGWPIKLHRFEANSLPDPADVLDCIVLINDRTDGIPRTRVAVSNGASFDYLGYLTDIPAAPQQQPVAQPLVPIQLPQYQPPQQVLLPPPAYNDTGIRRDVFQAQAENRDLARRVTELERVIDALHDVATARISKERV